MVGFKIRKNLVALTLVLILLLTTLVLATQTPLKKLLFKPKAAAGQLSQLAFNLTFTPLSQSVTPGSSFNLPIYLNTDGGNISGADLVVSYDSAKLTPTSLTPNTSTVSTTSLKTFAPVNPATGSFQPDLTKNPLEFGVITFDWANTAPTGPFNGVVLLANLAFQVKPTATGTTTVSFVMTPGSTTDSNIVSTTNPPADFLTLASQISNTTLTITATPPTPTLIPTLTPTPTQITQNIAPWLTVDVGNPVITGSASQTNAVFTLTGSGSDIWGTTDQFRYVYQPITGNASITTRVATVSNTNPWTKAGVMIRETLTGNSSNAMMRVTPGSKASGMQYRLTTGATSSSIASTPQVPLWVRVTRSGNTFSGYWSNDGTAWTLVNSVTINMSNTVYAGLVLTSHDNSLLATATYSNVALQTATPTQTTTPSQTPTPVPTTIPTLTPTIVPSTSSIDFILNFEGAVPNSGKSKTVQITYGTTTKSVTVTPLANSSNHSGTISDLTPNQPYSFRIKGPQHLGKLITVSTLLSGQNSLNWSNTPLKSGDINNDNIVNLTDYSSFLGQFAPTIQKDSTSDLNFDGYVDISDYSLLVRNFNPTAPGE